MLRNIAYSFRVPKVWNYFLINEEKEVNSYLLLSKTIKSKLIETEQELTYNKNLHSLKFNVFYEHYQKTFFSPKTVHLTLYSVLYNIKLALGDKTFSFLQVLFSLDCR